MNKIEIVLIVLAVLTPIIGLLFVVNFKKSKKSKAKESKPESIENKPEGNLADFKVENKEQTNIAKRRAMPLPSFDRNEMKDFLMRRSSSSSKPVFNPRSDFPHASEFSFQNGNLGGGLEKRTIKEEISSSSPEVKIMLIDGILNPKDLDEY